MTLKNMEIVGERRTGFASFIIMKCNMCNLEKEIQTVFDKCNINESGVMGIINIGSGYSHLEQFSSALDIPCMSQKTYSKYHDKVCHAWEDKSLETMAKAAKEERELAIAAGEISSDGIPLITVVCDGSWAKRSYRCNYTSLSGLADIVGYRTKKVSFVGIKNKYCVVCKKAEAHHVAAKQHECFKNWTGSSTSMEAAIILEGFLCSIKMHGLIYDKMVADGDSSCYKKENYLRMRWAVSKAIQYRKKENCSIDEKICHLKLDILNGPSHIFGEHKNCLKSGYFCQEPFIEKDNDFCSFKLTNLHDSLMTHVRYLANHANSLIFDVDNNIVEQFNAVVAKFIGGKRINFCKKRSYIGRCAAAVVSHNTKRPMYEAYKQLLGRSPGKYAKRIEMRNRQRLLRMRESANERNIIRSARKLNFSFSQKDKYYGPHCNKPDMTPENYEISKEAYLKDNMNMAEKEIQEIEENTRIQSQSQLWFSERRKRVTASKFYTICTKLPYTSRKSLVRSIIQPKDFSSAATDYGVKHETDAIKCLSKKIEKEIIKCGLFIDQELQFLAATPDGVIDKDSIVEVKCPYSSRNMSPQDGIESRKILFWKKDGTVNKNHKWFFQIQGQLHITKRLYCYFAVWTPLGLKMEIIEKQDNFWNNRMLDKLQSFYIDCMLPELIDSRLDRNMDIREPSYVENAINKRKADLSARKICKKKKKV
ncbi:hypothetical protein RN001_005264 [Aquatica leii]|uniref:YqaJ viral recombinase domain-containing protein n=1 Tax=Aquatica leii TaxID=1421715 RepID=A0AAN7Q6H6_9COLE|nr:hypothetical protein RN001_005264 [Aquatica leii]